MRLGLLLLARLVEVPVCCTETNAPPPANGEIAALAKTTLPFTRALPSNQSRLTVVKPAIFLEVWKLGDLNDS
ncbi:hypothetical protein AC1031_017208 [Aphanomyces cochlioides]|nr:hypothetical protein AC1031_017205 [Aphanomyces cochlioides]KAG9411572.1 hypothetical protein AC1031_017206 [Aphanomyces cochlioides]KAG9411573.1 hypothetical protein AC1031_017207 [Aphanomyces cochlioides]KAG9411574.1 hypothetical protein AC1031_017208 [Aphanomyces cochlioides]